MTRTRKAAVTVWASFVWCVVSAGAVFANAGPFVVKCPSGEGPSVSRS